MGAAEHELVTIREIARAYNVGPMVVIGWSEAPGFPKPVSRPRQPLAFPLEDVSNWCRGRGFEPDRQARGGAS